MKTRVTREKNGHDTRSASDDRAKDRVSSPNYIAVLAVLNAIVQRVSNSLPVIREATRMLPDHPALLNNEVRCAVSR